MSIADAQKEVVNPITGERVKTTVIDVSFTPIFFMEKCHKSIFPNKLYTAIDFSSFTIVLTIIRSIRAQALPCTFSVLSPQSVLPALRSSV